MLLLLTLLVGGSASFADCFASNSSLLIDLQNNVFKLQLWRRLPLSSSSTGTWAYLDNSWAMSNKSQVASDPGSEDDCLVYSSGFNATLHNEFLQLTTSYPSAPGNIISLFFTCPYDMFTCRGLATEFISFKYVLSLLFSGSEIKVSKNVDTVSILGFNYSNCWNNINLVYNVNTDYDSVYVCVIVSPLPCALPVRLGVESSGAYISITVNNSQLSTITFPVMDVSKYSEELKNKLKTLPLKSMFRTPYVHADTTHFCHVCNLYAEGSAEKIACVEKIGTLSQSVDFRTSLVYSASYYFNEIHVSADVYAATTSYETARYSGCFNEPQVWIYPASLQIQLTPSPTRNKTECANPIGLDQTYMIIDIINKANISDTYRKKVPLNSFSWEKNTYWLFCDSIDCHTMMNKIITGAIQVTVMQYIAFHADSGGILDTVIVTSNAQNITCLNSLYVSFTERSLQIITNLNTRPCLPLQDALAQRSFYRITLYESGSEDLASQNFTRKGQMTVKIKDYTVGQMIPMDCDSIDVSMTTMTCTELFSWMRRAARDKRLLITLIYGDFTYSITRVYYDGSTYLILFTVILALIIGTAGGVYTYLSVRRFIKIITKLTAETHARN